MLIYDDTAAAAVQAAAEVARRLGAAGYDTRHVLLGLLGSDDPVTRRVTEGAPHLSADAVRAALTARQPASAAAGADSASDRPPTPAREFRRAMSDFVVKWGPLIKARQLPRRPKFSSAELWLMVLERSALSSQHLQALGCRPAGTPRRGPDHDGRGLAAGAGLAGRGATGSYERFIARLIGRGRTRRS